jgi:hypothetical protein
MTQKAQFYSVYLSPYAVELRNINHLKLSREGDNAFDC